MLTRDREQGGKVARDEAVVAVGGEREEVKGGAGLDCRLEIEEVSGQQGER